MCICTLQLSLVEYDPEVNDLKVVSLHQFEEDDIRVSIQFQNNYKYSTYHSFGLIRVEIVITSIVRMCALTLRGGVRPC